MNFFNKNRFSLRQVVIMLSIAFAGVAAISYAALTVPNNFTAGSTISAAQVNQNFSTLASAMPGIKAGSAENVILAPPLNLNGFSSAQVILSLTVTAPANGRYLLIASGVAKTQTGSDNTSSGAQLYLVTDTQPGPVVNNGSGLWGKVDSEIGSQFVEFAGGNGLTANNSPIFHTSPFSFMAVTPPTLAGSTTTYHLAGWNGWAGPSTIQAQKLVALFVPTDLQ
jgi:hypothetical protein